MSKLKNYGLCLAANVVIFAIAFGIIRAIPALNLMDVTIHGWAWAVFIPTFIGLNVLGRYLRISFGTSLKGSVLEPSATAVTMLSEVSSMIGLALALFVTGAIVPSLVGYASAWGVLSGATIFGAAFGLAELVRVALFPQGK